MGRGTPHRTHGAAAYSGVHTGVHYPLDLIAGAVADLAVAPGAIDLLVAKRTAVLLCASVSQIAGR
jgi:hypothetical protein